MIRTKYKIEKKSALELKAEEAAAKAAALREQLQAALDDGQKVAKRTQKKLDKKATKRAKVAKKQTAAFAKKADKHAKKGSAALAGTALGVAGLAQEKAQPLVEKAHDTLVDEIMPRLSDALQTAADHASAAKDAAAERIDDVQDDDHGVAKTAAGLLGAKKLKDIVSSDDDDHGVAKTAAGLFAAKKAKDVVSDGRDKGCKGTGLMVLGLALAAAAAALTAYKQMQPQEDPWATPLLDPYTPATGTASATTAAGTDTVGAQQGGTVAFSSDEAGTDVELTPAESAQGGDVQPVLEPVEGQLYSPTARSDAGSTPADDGAGELLSDDATQVMKVDENGRVETDKKY